jgi:GWxTD domain-containing protein
MSRVGKLLVVLVCGGVFACPAALRAHPKAQDAAKQESAKEKVKQQKKRDKELLKELAEPYRKWLSEDVAYIITPEERDAFLHLQTNEEREQFIEQFWERRNPDPNSPENTYKEEIYRRIAYANEHFASGIPGWRTDRGRMYIMWGPPDEIDTHPSGGSYQRPPSEGGGETSTYPFEDWTYRYLPGIGENITLEFVDPTMTGEYHLTVDPCEKDALLHVPNAGLTQAEQMGLSSKAQRLTTSGLSTCGAPLGAQPVSMNEFNRLEQYYKVFRPPEVKFKDLEAVVTSRILRNELPFQYRFDFLRVTDDTDLVPITVQIPNREMAFQEKDGVQTSLLHVFGQISTLGGRVAQTFEDTVKRDFPSSLLQQELKGQSIYQKAVPLRPGLYRLDIVVKDVNSGNVGVINTRLPVPRFDQQKLASSTLILADDMEPVSARDVGLGQFVLGDVKVRPKLDAAFTTDQKMGVYLQVYNLKMDDKTHKSDAKIQYRILEGNRPVLVKTETSGQLGQNGEQLTIEKIIDLGAFQPGRYRLEITINDQVAQQTVTQSADFSVKPAEKMAAK